MDKPLSLFAKLVLLGAGGLAVVAGPVLYLFPHDTGMYFAWTIQHPLTPLYMGASYFAGVGNLLVVRVDRWSLARVQLPAILVFSSTMLLATLLNIPIFHWTHPVAWAWLAVYVVSPVAALLVFRQMEQGYRAPLFDGQSLPGWLPTVMLLFAAISGVIGLALILFPALMSPLWAWSLTPLTSRVIGGWWLSGAALHYMLSRQPTLHTAWVGLLANLLVTGLLLAGAIALFDTFDGPRVSVALYLFVNLALGAVCAYSWLRSRPTRS